MSNYKQSDEVLLDNAACGSQNRGLLEDAQIRECLQLNVIDPLRARIAALEAENKRLAKGTGEGA